MRYSRTRNAFLSGSVWPVGLALTALVVVFLVLRVFAPQVLVYVASPLWKAGSALSGAAGYATVPFANVVSLQEERDALLRENEALRIENAALTAAQSDRARVEAEGRAVAGVLVRPPVSPYDVLVVDTGAGNGIAVGALAYGPGGTPVGIVESVTVESARVALYSSPGRSTEGWVGEARLPITLTGKGSGAFQAFLSREAAVAVGDAVYLPGPGALPVGSVVRIESDPSSPRATIHIHPMVSPFSLTWVSIAR